MSTPSVATIKRLFAVSGNRCAFPACNIPLVDTISGKVTGRICHIKARRPDGKRYDPDQTEEDRHAFDNLMLMCPIHHDVIDADDISYSVDRLKQIKLDHESKSSGAQELSDGLAQQFIANVLGSSITNGSLIFSQNQMGGQVAHSITNVGVQPRNITAAAAAALIAELRKFPGERFTVESIIGDTEGLRLGETLAKILQDAGWQHARVEQSMIFPTPRGVVIETPETKPALTILLNWVHRAGLKPKGLLNQSRADTRITIGAQI